MRTCKGWPAASAWPGGSTATCGRSAGTRSRGPWRWRGWATSTAGRVSWRPPPSTAHRRPACGPAWSGNGPRPRGRWRIEDDTFRELKEGWGLERQPWGTQAATIRGQVALTVLAFNTAQLYRT